MLEEIKQFAKNVLQVSDDVIESFDATKPDEIVSALQTQIVLRTQADKVKQEEARKSQYKRGLIESATKYEKSLKEIFEIQEEIAGDDLIEVAKKKKEELSSTGGKSNEDIKALKAENQRLLIETQKKIDDAVTPLKAEKETLLKELKRKDNIYEAKSKVIALSDKYVMPEEEKPKKKILDLIFNDIGDLEFTVIAGVQYIKEGEDLKKDEVGNPISYDKKIEMIMSDYLSPKKSSGGKASDGATEKAQEGKQADLKAPKDKEEYYKFLQDPKVDSKDKREYMSKYSKLHG
jgi:hypothetical protein